MKLSKINKTLLAIGLSLTSISVLAAGLGQLNVSSAIGEPLSAEVELLSVTAAEKSSLKAQIAPASAYAAQGITRPASHSDIKIRISKDSRGKNVLKLSSNQPMSEPFLDMLLELEWETGRILREYTVLLDPPGYEAPVTASKIQAPTIKTVDNKAKNTPTTSTTKTTQIKTQPSPATSPAIGSQDDYLTKRGDTLSKIARQMMPEGVSLDQMLIGLYEANPEAFVGNNMNRLKVGKILQAPTAEALNKRTTKQATREVKVQTENWNAYRNKLAGIVESDVAEAGDSDEQSSSGKIKAAPEDQSAPESQGPKDVVKLSSGDAKALQADMEAKITSLQEEVSAREKGLSEAQGRISALEKQIEDMQKLLTLKSDAMSKAQEQAIQEAATKQPEAEGAIGADETAQQMPAETADPEVVEPSEVTAEAKTEKAPAEVVAPQPAPAAKPKPVAPTPAPVEVAQKSFLDNAVDTVKGVLSGLNMALIGGAAAVIALLLGAWMYLRNKRKRNLADFEQGIMTSGGLKANTVFGNTSGTSVDTGDTSFLTDFSQSTSGGMIDTNDVDPIAEAEVYMAYGRDAQAEEILKDAIAKEPKRYELHLKLLEMYAASKDMSAFETVSGELYTTLGAEDPTWAKVAEIGIKLEPNNPLYQVQAGVGDGVAAVAETSADAPEAQTSSGDLDPSDFADSPLASEADLDFSLNDEPAEVKEDADQVMNELADDLSGAVGTSEAEVADQPESVDLSVDATALDVPNVEEVVESQQDDGALDFDMGSLEVPTVTDESEAVAEPTPADASLNFEHTMPNLDLSGVDSDEKADNVLKDDVSDDGAKVAEIEAPTLDLPETSVESAVAELEEAVQGEAIETPAAEETFDFDVNTITEDTVTLGDGAEEQAETAAESSEAANVLDLSGISLDVNDDVNQAIADAPPEVEAENVAADAPAESEEVETKLELVAAYIDMEDKEGAKELLDEVLKEGGENQRKRAEEILASLS